MGLLLKLTGTTFEAVWEGWQLGARPKNTTEIRKAVKIEDKICAISTEESGDTELGCPKCHERFKVTDAERFNFWRVPTKRVLIEDAAPLFFEDDEFAFFKESMSGLQPPQPRLRAYAAFWDQMDAAEKDWKGTEPDLRKKLADELKPTESSATASAQSSTE